MNWRDWFARSPQPGEFPPAAAPAGKLLVLAEGDSASLDYFVRPWLHANGNHDRLVDSRAAPPAGFSPQGVGGVVIVRYLPPAWFEFLCAARRAAIPVVYFMDDDLMDASAHVGLPEDYRHKLDRLALSQRARIEAVACEYWVSNAALAAKYPSWRPRVLPARDGVAAALPPVTICYHGTASHLAEQQWLLALAGELQAASPRTHFSIVGDATLNKTLRGLPRVSVTHPLRWPNYVAYTQSRPADIALAPLLPSPFNAMRGPTKFFDIARLGAAGLYADVTPYREVVRHDVDGLLLPMDREAWLLAILALIDDAPRRRRLADAARARAAAGPLV